MPLLVDGDNLLGTWPGRSRSDGDKRELVRTLGRAGVAKGQRTVVVFDGEAPYPLGADVLFSGRGRRADDVILQTLRDASDPRGWTVITSDKSLGDQCRWLGARVERCDVFRARLTPAASDEKPAGSDDLAYWEKVFGGDDSAGE